MTDCEIEIPPTPSEGSPKPRHDKFSEERPLSLICAYSMDVDMVDIAYLSPKGKTHQVSFHHFSATGGRQGGGVG